MKHMMGTQDYGLSGELVLNTLAGDFVTSDLAW